MSKKVTATSKAVNVGDMWICLASDGTIRATDSVTCRGDEVGGFNTAVTKSGLAAVKKAAPILIQIDKLQVALSKINTGQEGDHGPVLFEGEEGDEACIRVGCTTVYPDELAGVMKSLGL